MMARAFPPLVAALALFAPLAAGDDAPAPTPALAIAAYDEGRYADAATMLRAIDARGEADGSLLYRLFFCVRSAGDAGGSRAILERAAAALEKEHASGAPGIETPFYLANAYANLGRSADARNVAAEATRRLESKEIREPETAIGLFQVGKLYQDQSRAAEAATWYRKALAAFDPASTRYQANVRWARRYLAESALSSADFATADREYTALVAAGGGGLEEYRHLALARCRNGSFAGAAEAWEEIVRRDPGNGDDARYSARLARMAADLGSLPSANAAGTAFLSLSKEDLEATMIEQVKKVRELRAEAAASDVSPSPEARKKAEEALLAAKGTFVAAGLEYANRKLPIRETAFTEGYAGFFFKPEEWELPPLEAVR
jgi:tetratricopeptide (TPR) repeat protein